MMTTNEEEFEEEEEEDSNNAAGGCGGLGFDYMMQELSSVLGVGGAGVRYHRRGQL